MRREVRIADKRSTLSNKLFWLMVSTVAVIAVLFSLAGLFGQGNQNVVTIILVAIIAYLAFFITFLLYIIQSKLEYTKSRTGICGRRWGSLSELTEEQINNALCLWFCSIDYRVLKIDPSLKRNTDLKIILDGKNKKKTERVLVYIFNPDGLVSAEKIQEIETEKELYKGSKILGITKGLFTRKAEELAVEKNIELWDNAVLNRLYLK